MILPTIHMNGDTGASLRDEHIAAWRAVKKAIDGVQKVGPNGRNFYPQGDAAIGQAIEEHRERIGKLVDVADQLYAIAEHCDSLATR